MICYVLCVRLREMSALLGDRLELLGFTEENEMTVLLTFTLDFLYWEYVAVPI